MLTHLCLSFSRHQPSQDAPQLNGATDGVDCPRYVQDNLLLYGKDIASFVVERGAVVYVCGDANNMARNVNTAICDALEIHRGIYSRIW